MVCLRCTSPVKMATSRLWSCCYITSPLRPEHWQRASGVRWILRPCRVISLWWRLYWEQIHRSQKSKRWRWPQTMVTQLSSVGWRSERILFSFFLQGKNRFRKRKRLKKERKKNGRNFFKGVWIFNLSFKAISISSQHRRVSEKREHLDIFFFFLKSAFLIWLKLKLFEFWAKLKKNVIVLKDEQKDFFVSVVKTWPDDSVWRTKEKCKMPLSPRRHCLFQHSVSKR